MKYDRHDELRREQVRSMVHLRFLAELYKEQMDSGRYFVHEHPLYAGSWELPLIKDLMADPRVDRVHGDQCQYGAQVRFGNKLGMPIKKPSGFMSNSPEVLKSLSRKCRGTDGRCSRTKGGNHAPCAGDIAKDAARYPAGLVRAVLRGFEAQLRKDGAIQNGIYGIQPRFDEDPVMQMEGVEQRIVNGMVATGKFKDDLTRQPLVDILVQEARKKELEYFAAKRVCG
jgi:hypothetical protein